MTCPAFNDRVAIDLPHGTTLYGRVAGCVFGDPTSAHEHFVYVDYAIWSDGSRHAGNAGSAGKFWSIRPLTDAEIAREAREYEAAMRLVD